MNNPWLEILNRKPSQDGEQQQESLSLSPPEKQYRDWYWRNALKVAKDNSDKPAETIRENIFGALPEEEFQKVLMRENLTGYPQEVEKTNEELDFLKKKLIESGANAGPSVDYAPLMALTSGSNSPSVRRVSENYLKSVKPDEPMQYLKNALSLGKDKLQNKQESLAELSKFLHANIQQLGTYQQGGMQGGASMKNLPPPPKEAAPKGGGAGKEVSTEKIEKRQTPIMDAISSTVSLINTLNKYPNGKLPGVGTVTGLVPNKSVPIAEKIGLVDEGSAAVRAAISDVVNKANKAMNSARATNKDRENIQRGLGLVESGDEALIREGALLLEKTQRSVMGTSRAGSTNAEVKAWDERLLREGYVEPRVNQIQQEQDLPIGTIMKGPSGTFKYKGGGRKDKNNWVKQ